MRLNCSEVYDALLKYNISLDFDNIPTPAYIQDKIVQCNGYQRAVEKHFINVQRALSESERLYRVEKLHLEMKKRQTLTNNSSVKRLPTGKEREAAVDELLEDDYRRLLDIENSACDLKDLLNAVRTVQYNLKGTNADIKLLSKVMEQQINRLNVGSPEDPEVKELYANMADIDRMEREMTLDDVEDSSEEIEEDQDEESIEIEDSITDIEDPEGIAEDDVSDLTNDESSDETQTTATSEEDSPGEEGEGIPSYISEDDFDISPDEGAIDAEESEDDEQQEDTEDESTSPVLEPEEGSAKQEKKTVKMSVDIDLDEIGIDLGDVGTGVDTPDMSESGSTSVEEVSGKDEELMAVAVSSAGEEQQVSEASVDPKKVSDGGIDIDDILSSIQD